MAYQLRISRRKRCWPLVVTDPVAAARAADLLYVSDEWPGIRRRRCGKGFQYVGIDGQPVRDPEELRRIKALAIPPAYREVWICPYANGHLQATARDARGRKQYRYHPAWQSTRGETKFTRLLQFSEFLPRIRERIQRDLARPGLPRDKVLATVVTLMECTRIRVGNEEYARANQSYGLTTMRDEHVAVRGATVRFKFRGKSGREHAIAVENRHLARIVKRCQDLPGQELFQYLDEDGQPQSIGSGDVNAYLKEITGEAFTAKDFRTWGGTLLAALILARLGPSASATETKRKIAEAIKETAEQLGNRPATCRKYYVHPAVLEAYQDQSLFELMGPREAAAEPVPATGLHPEERQLVAVLERQLRRNGAAGGKGQP
jgi:DNA topoisomerase-1